MLLRGGSGDSLLEGQAEGLHCQAPPQLEEPPLLLSPVTLSRDVPPRLLFLDIVSSWLRSSYPFLVEVTNAEIILLSAEAVKER